MPKQYCSLSDQELITKAEEHIVTLINTGGRAWSLPVPANPDKDVDLILSEVIERFKQHVRGETLIINNANGTTKTIIKNRLDQEETAGKTIMKRL